MTREEKAEYRRKRNSIGWLLALGWIAYCFMRPTDGSFTGDLGHAGMIVLSLVTWPLAFVASHYIARIMVEIEGRRQMAAEDAAEQRNARLAESQRVERMQAIDTASMQVRQTIDRSELINKLATVRDYLALLASTSDPQRILRIEQSIDRELRELIAKHDPAALQRLMRGDQPIELSLRALIESLERRGALSADALALRALFETA